MSEHMSKHTITKTIEETGEVVCFYEFQRVEPAIKAWELLQKSYQAGTVLTMTTGGSSSRHRENKK